MLLCCATHPARAQGSAESGTVACNVASRQPLEVTDQGELARPPPTAEECETAAALEAKFLATNPGEFRQVRNWNRLPEVIRAYIDRIGAIGEPRDPVNVQVGRYSPWPDIVSWLSTELVVLAYRRSDLSGTSTTIVLGDLTTLDACAYLRLRAGTLPAELSIAEIQGALDRGRLGNRQIPVCHPRFLMLE